MIEITSVNPINKGDILANISVSIKPWKLTIHDIVVMQKGINRWINLPSRKYESNGTTKYKNTLEFTDNATDKRFKDQILKAVDAYIESKGALEPEDVIRDEELPF